MLKKVVLLVVALALLAQFGVDGLKCFADQCSVTGSIGKKCSEDLHELTMEMCLPGSVCVKQNIPETEINNIYLPSLIIRGCGVNNYCKTRQHTGCYDCEADLCNSGAGLIPSFMIIILYILKCIVF